MTNEYLVKAYLFWDSLTRNRSDGALVRLIVPIPEGGVEEQADRQLAQVRRRPGAGARRLPAPLTTGHRDGPPVRLDSRHGPDRRADPAADAAGGVMHVLDEPAERKVHERPDPPRRRHRHGHRRGRSAAALAGPRPALGGLCRRGTDRAAVRRLGRPRHARAAAPSSSGQLIAVLIVVIVGGVSIHSITLVGRIELPPFVAMPLTIFFLLGVTNAINLADGLDGLAGGTTFLCCAAIAILGLGTDAGVRLHGRRAS